ncbi:hypothetical protein EOK75_17275 (plasmid) [Pseudorhodobacter turbinis]|uniref:Uncharacterized protein n=1 Tax=Pseudorhodobacter turbinis TaxID=2500533 RepID=A0A4P8EL10_9RHOB|nr:hypothetical protein [Pseudorhodobacter turbinis]QCO57465.1 hypothetical protein EOK75_17275 [Pseudorhodobacter turbinis]
MKRIRTCAHCDAELTGSRSQKYCNQVCKNAANNAKNNALSKLLRTQEKTCVVCDATFTTSKSSTITCSVACAEIEQKNKVAAHNAEADVLCVKLRRMFIELTSKFERENFAKNLIEEHNTNPLVRTVFHRVNKVFKPLPKPIYKLNYNPKKDRPSPSQMKDKHVVMVHAVIDLKAGTVDYVAGIFKDSIPHFRDSIFIGAYKNLRDAKKKVAEINTVLSYDDERTVLLIDYRLVNHDRSSAALLIEEIDMDMNVFTYTELYSKLTYKDSVLINYYNVLAQKELDQ